MTLSVNTFVANDVCEEYFFVSVSVSVGLDTSFSMSLDWSWSGKLSCCDASGFDSSVSVDGQSLGGCVITISLLTSLTISSGSCTVSGKSTSSSFRRAKSYADFSV